MLIGVHKRFVFVANTKTASTSIEHVLMEHSECLALGNPRRKHMPLADVLKSYHFLFGQPNHKPETYFKFGVMRDPIEWIGSWFRYRRGNQVESPLPEGITFEEFWRKRDWNIVLGSGEPHLQRRMFVDAADNVLADVIIPHHRLDEYFPKICAALKIPYSLPYKNKSVIKQADPIPAALEAEMREFYAKDYALMARLDEINATGMERLLSRQKG